METFKIKVSNFINKIGTFATLIGGLVALILFYKSKADKASAKNITAETKIKDAPLAAKQDELKEKIKDADNKIKDIMDERKKNRDEYLSDQERANKWNPSK